MSEQTTKIDADHRVLEKIKKVLVKSATKPVGKIILYGSRATGQAREDSDFDILVVQKGSVSKLEESLRLRQLLRDFPYPVDVWVMSEEEFEETKNIIGGLAYPANKYGVVLE